MIVHFNNNSKFWMDEGSNFTDIYILYILYIIYMNKKLKTELRPSRKKTQFFSNYIIFLCSSKLLDLRP